ncbi:hypothetical protein JCM9492_16090 [Aquifex pyrophilus]
MSSLVLWSPLLPSFHFVNQKPRELYLYSSQIKKFFKTALIFYSLKKDAKLRNEVRHYILTHKKVSLSRFLNFVQKTALSDKEEILKDINIPERIKLDEKNLKKVKLFLYDLKRDEESFFGDAYVYQGIIEIPFESSHYEKIKSASHSYVEALIHAEHTLTRGKGRIEDFYLELSSSVKNWEIPLRLGVWTPNPISARLFWFWGDKEVRDRVRKLYRIELRPHKLFYIPSENQTLGWSEVRDVRSV